MEKPQIIELAAHGVSGAHYANSYFTVLLLSVHFSTDIQARIHDCQLSHFCLLRATTCTHAHNGTTAVRNQRIKSSLNMPIDVVCYIGAYVVCGAIALQPREIEVLFSIMGFVCACSELQCPTHQLTGNQHHFLALLVSRIG